MFGYKCKVKHFQIVLYVGWDGGSWGHQEVQGGPRGHQGVPGGSGLPPAPKRVLVVLAGL